MIYGISFNVNQSEKRVLSKIFNDFKTEDLNFYIELSQCEVFTGEKNMVFFEKELYNGNEFSIKINENHFPIFVKIQIYSNSIKKQIKNINGFDDFSKSNCEAVMLLFDCEFVEIYVKNLDIANSFYNTAMDNGFKNVLFLNQNDINRSSLNIL